ncbi:MAG: leucyl/phenylalanyl-tRNA--protein transferase [Phycisphaeraceae bacterium]
MTSSIQLDPQTVLAGYAAGLFPMADGRHGPLGWYECDPRAVLPLDERFHVSRSLVRQVRRGRFRVTRDEAFEPVIRACARPELPDEEVWLTEPIIAAFVELHRLELAHSVEAWEPGEAGPELVGGVYGLAMGGAFFAESMFSRATDASKVCLVHLVEHLREKGFSLLDAQVPSPHLEQFGMIETGRSAYHAQLRDALEQPVRW